MARVTYRAATPFTPVACQTLRRPASFLAHGTLRVRRQVTLPPVMFVVHGGKVLAGDVGSILFAVGHGEVLTLDMHEIIADCGRERKEYL